MRIALEVRRTLDLSAARTQKKLFIYRLWGRVRFRQSSGWSENHLALIDTGAPYSVIPASLWPALQTKRLLDVPLRGIVPGNDAKINATLAKVSGRILDSRDSSPTLSLWAMLVRTEPVPLILGWSGLLDRCRLTLDARRKIAWVEF